MAGYVYRGTPDKPKPPKPKAVPKCGTRSGYRTHRTNNEPACDECRAANTAYNTDWSRRKFNRKPQIGFTTDQCGTTPGYSSHRRHNIPMCDPCRAAFKEYNKRRYLKKTAA